MKGILLIPILVWSELLFILRCKSDLLNYCVFFRIVVTGKRLIKIAKSSISPCVGFFFCITSSGISLLDDEGVEMMGPEANAIHCQGLIQTLNASCIFLSVGSVVYSCLIINSNKRKTFCKSADSLYRVQNG